MMYCIQRAAGGANAAAESFRMDLRGKPETGRK